MLSLCSHLRLARRRTSRMHYGLLVQLVSARSDLGNYRAECVALAYCGASFRFQVLGYQQAAQSPTVRQWATKAKVASADTQTDVSVCTSYCGSLYWKEGLTEIELGLDRLRVADIEWLPRRSWLFLTSFADSSCCEMCSRFCSLSAAGIHTP